MGPSSHAVTSDQLKRDIAATRARLGADLDALVGKINPATAARDRGARVRDTATRALERVTRRRRA
ncbi:DUF3618 domain-containing protein [Streptomyces avicenniae]|uniref:DUF3618 domain-containing protein n=1 Tax=Streptomyces avicenniae TaxID=500153 RepID=UPI000A465596|nr:DUF3618 domain-containing protein [Streptomyces avicenniae]